MKTQKKRYNYELLKNYCQENNIELLKDYSNDKINRDSIIEGKCIHIDCNETFSKNFKILLLSKGYCSFHTKQNRKETFVKNCLEKIWCEMSFTI